MQFCHLGTLVVLCHLRKKNDNIKVNLLILQQSDTQFQEHHMYLTYLVYLVGLGVLEDLVVQQRRSLRQKREQCIKMPSKDSKG